MTKVTLEQAVENISLKIGARDSLLTACEWVLCEWPETSEDRKYSWIKCPVPPVTPTTPRLDASSPSFAAQLLKAINDRYDGDAPKIYHRAGVARQIYSKIVSDETAGIAKRTAIRFALALKLSLPDAERLLKAAGFAFSDNIAEDVIVRACIEAGVYDFVSLNKLLSEYGVPYYY